MAIPALGVASGGRARRLVCPAMGVSDGRRVVQGPCQEVVMSDDGCVKRWV